MTLSHCHCAFKAILTLGCFTALSSSYKITDTGKCVAEDGDSPPRRVAGFVAPNMTALDGSGRGSANDGDESACGCDPNFPPGFPQLYQTNRICPFNAEPLLGPLAKAGHISPETLFLKRNHAPIPVLEEPSSYRLSISLKEGDLDRNSRNLRDPGHLTLEKIKTYPKHNVTALICCAGNRRSEVNYNKCPAPPEDSPDGDSPRIEKEGRERWKTVDGVSWGAAALGNANHAGALLADVLADIINLDALDTSKMYVEMEGADIAPEETEQGSTLGFAAALPLDYVLDPKNQVLLAYEMNGEELPPHHGYPLRAIVPGQLGARSVKWLVKITLLREPSKSYFMQRDYKHFSPNTLPRNTTPPLDDEVYDAAAPFASLNVQVGITSPSSPTTNIVGKDMDITIEAGRPLKVEGFAFSGGGNAAQAIYVCLLLRDQPLSKCDEYPGWTAAEMNPPAVPHAPLTETPRGMDYSWAFWSAELGNVRYGEYYIVARAADTANQNMPEQSCPIYNWRGVLNNAWFKLPVTANDEPIATRPLKTHM